MSETDRGNVTSRTVKGSFYSLIAAAITLTLGFARFILLLLFLLPEDFGVVTQAMFFVTLAAQLRLPDIDLAIIQRQQVSEPVLRTYFSMKMGLLGASVLLMALVTPLIGSFFSTMPLLTVVLLALLGLEIVKGLNGVQEALLRRSLAFRQIAIADIISAIAMTLITPYLAWRGYGAWSLVAEAFIGQFARGGIVWLFARVWWPKLGWNRDIASELWQFSSKLWGNSALNFVTDRFDDYWIGWSLGSQSLGYYSRAYEAARYPRRVIATPLVTVFYSAYARLQGEKHALSQAFFRLTSLMVRASFGFSLIFVLLAPEFVSLLGDTWQPMLLTFQLMIIYTLLDPLAVGAGDLLIAIGRPELLFQTKIFQVVIFIPAVILFGRWGGLEGVALAANLMVGIGTFILFRLTHRFLDYSARRLWMWPTVALLVTGTAVFLLNPVWFSLSVWLAMLTKFGLICLLYGGVLLIFEREEIVRSYQLAMRWIRPAFSAFRLRLKN